MLLINPPGGRSVVNLTDGDKFISENIGLGYLASYLRTHSRQETRILDAYLCGMTAAEVAEVICGSDPLLVGFAVSYHPALGGMRRVLDELSKRQWRGRIVVGGNHASLASEAVFDIAPEVSAVVHGDGEETLAELVEAIRTGTDWSEVAGMTVRAGGGLIKTKIRPLSRDLDDLPFPARDTLPLVLARGGLPYVSASRGCYARCKFCTITAFYDERGPRWRGRSAQNVAREIEELVETFDVGRVFFVDDNFMGPGRKGQARGLEFASALREARSKVAFSIQTRSDDLDREVLVALKEAGLRLVFLGLESGSQSALDFYRKDNTVLQNIAAVELLEELGLGGIYGLIMFNPKTTWEQFWETMEFLGQVNDYNLLWIPGMLRDLPGAEFAAELGDVPTFIGPDGFSFFGIEDPSIRHLAASLSWVLTPAREVLEGWEETKWNLYMRFDQDRAAISDFRFESRQLQVEALGLLSAAAAIVERAFRHENRLAGQLDLIEQHLGFAAINERYRMFARGESVKSSGFATAVVC